MSIKHELAGRLGFVYLFVIIFAAAIVVQALNLQILKGDELRNMVLSYSVKDNIVPPTRGDILSDDGRVLASSVPYYTLFFDGVSVPDTIFKREIDSLSIMLSRFFGDASSKAYRNKIWNARYKKRPDRYLRINHRKVTHNELKYLKTLPIFRERGTRSGLIAKMESVRVRPYGPMAERTIGYLNEDDDGNIRGNVGIEESFEEYLEGLEGRSVYEMMSGRWVPVTVEEPINGNDVVTTINVEYQNIVQSALLSQLKKYEAHAGTAILMEVKSGAIKAMANLSKTSVGYGERLNTAIYDAAEPGSVFKAAMMVALLEDKYVHPDDTIDLGNGQYFFGNRVIKESHGREMGEVTVRGIFERSSNGISKLIDNNYRGKEEKLITRLCAMGLNDPVGIELKGEGIPYISKPTNKDVWSRQSLPSMSIGYEIKQTPLQILAFYNALANGGIRMKPYLVKEIKRGGSVVKRFHPERVGSKICSEETLGYMHEMMEGVVERGTAVNVKSNEYKIAGKTGTARIADDSRGYKGIVKYRASFVGYFPADDPIYSCIVVIDSPSTSKGYYGNVVSGGVFKEISDKVYALASLEKKPELESNEEKSGASPISKEGLRDDFVKIYSTLNIPFKEEGVDGAKWVTTGQKDDNIVINGVNVGGASVPNVKGMGLRDALFLLENRGLKVTVIGAGSVRTQSIAPGTQLKKGRRIVIELR